MASVTARINQIKQPRGGYIKPSQFKETAFDDGLNPNADYESVHASIVGMAVDYLTRFLMGAKIEDAFKISMLGYKHRIMILGERQLKRDQKQKLDITTLLEQIKGLDDNSIIAACKATTYDVWYRNPMGAIRAKEADEIILEEITIENIRIMVNRSLLFWEKYGPIIKDGFTFENGGYTATVHAGDGDFLTADTLWDFKVSKSRPTNRNTLQLLMYWIMGQHSGKEEFTKITKLGIFNPRLNKMYLLNMSEVPAEVIEDVEQNVICY